MAGNNDDDVENLQYKQRLKAAFHYTVNRICQEVLEDEEVTISRQTVAAIAETLWKQTQNFAEDLEMFAKHGKRSTINADDVKLLVRKSPKVHEFISMIHEKNNVPNKKKSKKTTAKKSTTHNDAESDEN